MADSRLDLAKAFVNATVSSRKETSRIDELTSSILTRYKALPGVLGVIGNLFKSQVAYTSSENKASKLSEQTLRDIRAQQLQILRLRDLELDRVTKIQAQLAKPDISATKKSTLMSRLEQSRDAARNYEVSLSRVGDELKYVEQVGIPAAKAVDRLAMAQDRLANSVQSTGFGKMINISGEINKTLIDANSSLGVRNQLMQAGLRVAAQTGVSLKTLNQAQKELVGLGFDLKDSYEQTLKITTQLIDGLGMSAEEAAGLAVTSKTANLQFKDLANTVSAIVDTTSLAADEAARYARELVAASKVAVGSGGRFSASAYTQNLKVASQLEGALKGTIGVQGDIANMLVKFTSLQKQGGIGLAFGTGGLDFLSKDQNSSKRVMMNIARTVKDANGIMLEAYAGMLDTNKETLQALGQLYREQGEKMFDVPPEMQERADFERRYREQLAQQNETFRLLGDKLMFIGAKAIGPLIGLINTVADRIIWLAQKFGEVKAVAVPAMVIVSTVVVSSVMKMVRSLWQFAASAVAVSAAMSTKFGGGAKGSGIGGAVASTATSGILEGLGSWIMGKFKKGAIVAGAEEVGGLVTKGLIGRVFGSLAGAFTGTLMRGLLGRGIALVGSAFLTGGWSILIGLVITLVAQFWPNLVSLFKGKGWSTDAGIKQKQKNGSEFSQTLDPRVEGLSMEIALRDRAMLNRKIQMLKEDASTMGATSDDIQRLRTSVAEAANREVSAFAGKAQRAQGVDAARDDQNRQIFLDMKESVVELNDVLSKFAQDFAQNEKQKERREQIIKEEERRRRAIDNSPSSLAANPMAFM